MYHKEYALSLEKDGSIYIGDGDSRCFAIASVPALCDLIETAYGMAKAGVRPIATSQRVATHEAHTALEARVARIERLVNNIEKAFIQR